MGSPNSSEEIKIIHYREPEPSRAEGGVDDYEVLDKDHPDLAIRVGLGGRMLSVYTKEKGDPPQGTIDDESIQWEFSSIGEGDEGEWLSTPIEDGVHEISLDTWSGDVDLRSIHLDRQEEWDEIQLTNQPRPRDMAQREVLMQNDEWELNLMQVGGSVLLEFYRPSFEENPSNPIIVNGVRMDDWDKRELDGFISYVMNISYFFKEEDHHRADGALRIEFEGETKEVNVITDKAEIQQYIGD